MISNIKFDIAAPQAEHDPKLREFFETLGSGFDIKNIDLTSAAKARPFLSPMVWAIYSALLAILMHGITRWHILKGGLGNKDLTDNEAISKLIKAALPHYSEYIDQNGPAAYYSILDALDTKLLDELKIMLSGIETDKAAVDQAAEIVRQSDAVLTQVKAADAKV